MRCPKPEKGREKKSGTRRARRTAGLHELPRPPTPAAHDPQHKPISVTLILRIHMSIAINVVVAQHKHAVVAAVNNHKQALRIKQQAAVPVQDVTKIQWGKA